jgi:hypothetical protein
MPVMAAICQVALMHARMMMNMRVIKNKNESRPAHEVIAPEHVLEPLSLVNCHI